MPSFCRLRAPARPEGPAPIRAICWCVGTGADTGWLTGRNSGETEEQRAQRAVGFGDGCRARRRCRWRSPEAREWAWRPARRRAACAAGEAARRRARRQATSRAQSTASRAGAAAPVARGPADSARRIAWAASSGAIRPGMAKRLPAVSGGAQVARADGAHAHAARAQFGAQAFAGSGSGRPCWRSRRRCRAVPRRPARLAMPASTPRPRSRIGARRAGRWWRRPAG